MRLFWSPLALSGSVRETFPPTPGGPGGSGDVPGPSRAPFWVDLILDAPGGSQACFLAKILSILVASGVAFACDLPYIVEGIMLNV